MKTVYFILMAGVFLVISACSSMMTPSQVNSELPTLTISNFLSPPQADQALAENKCRILVKERIYRATIGFTVKGDLRNAAKGIDEYVVLDGGNTYVLRNYEWEIVDEEGSTQLIVTFDTMVCE